MYEHDDIIVIRIAGYTAVRRGEHWSVWSRDSL
jgi:hypothetical protein